MKITFDENVLERLNNLSNSDTIFALDYDNSLSDDVAASSCDIISRIRIVATAKEKLPKEFDGEMNSNLGTIIFKSYGKNFLENEMTMRKKNDGRLEVISSAGVLSPNAEIVDYR